MPVEAPPEEPIVRPDDPTKPQTQPDWLRKERLPTPDRPPTLPRPFDPTRN